MSGGASMMHWREAILGLLGAIAVSEGAIAHGVVIQTEVKPVVEVLGQYEDGTPLKQGQVKVFSTDNPEQPQFVGQTDDQGRYTFQPTKVGEWEIFIRQAGHGGQTVLDLENSEKEGVIIAKTTTGYSWPQRLIMIGAVFWGCIGTALYFKGRSL